jgi:hypothetical protein
MGQYFKIVNPVKRQYIDIGHFAGENEKTSGVMQGNHAVAVAVLMCKLDEVSHNFGMLAGSWYGDPIIAAGDDYGQPDQYGIQTSMEQEPQRNLNQMASEEFEDITYQALAMLCQGREGFAEDMAHWAKVSPDYVLVDLGNTVFQVGCEPLERALNDILGLDWTKQYEQARGKYPPHCR